MDEINLQSSVEQTAAYGLPWALFLRGFLRSPAAQAVMKSKGFEGL